MFRLTDELSCDKHPTPRHGRARCAGRGRARFLALNMRLRGAGAAAKFFRSRSTWRPASQNFGNSASNPLRRCLDLAVSDMGVTHGHAHIGVTEQTGDNG